MAAGPIFFDGVLKLIESSTSTNTDDDDDDTDDARDNDDVRAGFFIAGLNDDCRINNDCRGLASFGLS